MLPGETIGTEEEFIPGKGTYLDEGRIVAAVAGSLHVDSKHRATMIPSEKLPDLKVGSIVYGRVDEVFESKAFVTIEFSEISSKKRTTIAQGLIPVSEIKNQYVRSIRDEIRVGDFIKGIIIEVNPFHILVGFKQRGLGVIKAFCSKCRHDLELKGTMLECQNCGNRENRTLGFPYGRV